MSGDKSDLRDILRGVAALVAFSFLALLLIRTFGIYIHVYSIWALLFVTTILGALVLVYDLPTESTKVLSEPAKRFFPLVISVLVALPILYTIRTFLSYSISFALSAGAVAYLFAVEKSSRETD